MIFWRDESNQKHLDYKELSFIYLFILCNKAYYTEIKTTLLIHFDKIYEMHYITK